MPLASLAISATCSVVMPDAGTTISATPSPASAIGL
jgi:hypothetical protein